MFDEAGKEHALFSGDTLFIDDVGRPDLAQHLTEELTEDKLARLLYHSLRDSIIPLPDSVLIFPAHGAGSACGKNLSKNTSDTLGHQKQMNYALNPDLTEDQFVKQLLTGLTQPPGYFPKNVLMNIYGYKSIGDVLREGTKPFDARSFEALSMEDEILVLDTRKSVDFVKEFIPGAINIGLDGDFSVWVGNLITDIRPKILLVTEPGRESEAVTRLARVGYDNCVGYLDGGFESWKMAGFPIDHINSMSAGEFIKRYNDDPDELLLDVRKKSEYDSEHVKGSLNIPLNYINELLEKIPRDKNTFVFCAGGYRSVIFISILRARGYENLINVEGGFNELKKMGKLDVSEFVAQTSML
jgi:rhodanese-related sulfurtransferase